MASELQFIYESTGSTLYFVLRDTSGQMWNTAGTPDWEARTVANWTDYDIALSETPASSFLYVGTIPAISGNMAAGWYWADIYEQAGASPAIADDTLVGQMLGYWDGSMYRLYEVNTGDAFAVVNHTDYGNAKLVRSTTPGNSLSVDASGKIATPDTQKVDVNTIKAQTVTCGAGVTINPQVGQDNKILTNASGHVSRVVLTDLATATTSVTNAVTVGTNNDKTGYGLSSGERTTLAAAIEAAIINELDGTAVMQAIADLIASDMTTGDLSVQAIASAVRDAILNRVLAGNHDTAGTPGKLLQDGATAATVDLVKAETALILADTAELQAAWADGGRLDLILDARASQSTQDEILAAVAALGDIAGTGEHAISVTVTTDSTPLQNVLVRVFDGSTVVDRQTTDESGECTLQLDAGTYRIVATRSGYQSDTTDDYEVTAAADLAIELATLSIPASIDPDHVTAYAFTYDEAGQLEAAVACTLQILLADTDDLGRFYDGQKIAATSDANGLVVWPGLPVGARVRYWRGATTLTTRRYRESLLDEDEIDAGVFKLPSLVGDE